MKSDIHPKNYRQVIFQDAGTGTQFLIGSTVQTDQTGTWTDGKEYPLYVVEISSASHPIYTGEQRVMDRAGRVEKFKARASKAKKQ
jgi:large subunit ribosomal protein L31